MKRALALTLMLAATPLAAEDFTVGDLVVEQPVAAASAKLAKTGAGYMAITNTGDMPDRLLAVKADFPMVQVHASVEQDGVARMVHLENGIELLPGETVTLAPGGLHVMFMGLGEPLVEGETIDATLVFEKAGDLDVIFTIESRSEIMQMHMGHGS